MVKEPLMQTSPGIDGSELLLWALNVLGVLFGFVASVLIYRLYDSIDKLEVKVDEHREDVLMNYPNHEAITSMKKDIMDRLDVSEHNIKNSVQNAILRHQLEGFQKKDGTNG